jgi:hypothetical protein
MRPASRLRIGQDLTRRFPSVAAPRQRLAQDEEPIGPTAVTVSEKRDNKAVTAARMSYAGLCTTGDRFLDRTQTTVCDESVCMAGLDKAILNDVGVELLRCPCSSRGVTYESGCPSIFQS